MTYLVDPEYGNRNGDNLTYCEDDEYDENACFNWVNHPIRQLYDNRKNQFHPSNPYDNEDSPWIPSETGLDQNRRSRKNDQHDHSRPQNKPCTLEEWKAATGRMV